MRGLNRNRPPPPLAQDVDALQLVVEPVLLVRRQAPLALARRQQVLPESLRGGTEKDGGECRARATTHETTAAAAAPVLPTCSIGTAIWPPAGDRGAST